MITFNKYTMAASNSCFFLILVAGKCVENYVGQNAIEVIRQRDVYKVKYSMSNRIS